MRRATWMAMVGVLATAALSGCMWDETRFFDLRVVNDTHAVVTIQPCWDVACLDTKGLPVTTLRPGASRHENSWWPNLGGGEVAVAILGPHGTQLGCLTTEFADGQQSGVIRTSQAAPCLRRAGGGGGG